MVVGANPAAWSALLAPQRSPGKSRRPCAAWAPRRAKLRFSAQGRAIGPNGGEPRKFAPNPSTRPGASVNQVDCLVRADIDVGNIRRLTVCVLPTQIHVTILALRYFSPRPLAGFQRA